LKKRNKDQKMSVVFLIDTSGSMGAPVDFDLSTSIAKGPIDELNSALIKVKEDILCDSVLANRLEIGIVAFDDEGRIERPIDLISAESSFPVLTAGGLTNLVSGMNIAMSMIEERRDFYKANYETSYRPMIILITDGAPTNTEDEINALDAEIQSESHNKKFLFIPFGMDGADFQLLAKLATQTTDERLKGRGTAYFIRDVSKFNEVFALIINGVFSNSYIGGTASPSLNPDVAQPMTFDYSA
jgi:uncharacterized protein YegL